MRNHIRRSEFDNSRSSNNWIDDLNNIISFINENGQESEDRYQQIKIKDPDNAIFLGNSKYGPIALDYSNIFNMKILNVGQSGSGKSYMARKLIEELQEKESIVFICDPEGEWVTLRACFDFVILGKSKQFGKCDIEINEENIEKIIENCIRSKTSAILLLNEWSDNAERLKLVAILNHYLLYKILPEIKYNNITVVYEEAQRFAPKGVKNPDKATSDSILSLKEFMSQCRRRKISAILITQRPAKLHADIVSQCNTRLIGKVDQNADIKTTAEFLDLKPKQHHILKELDKEFIPKGDYFFHQQQLSPGTIVTFKADKVRSPHLDLRDLNDWVIPMPKSELRDKINFITSQLGVETEKNEQNNVQVPQNKVVEHPGQATAVPQTQQKPIEQRFSNKNKIGKFEQIVSFFGSISLRDLYLLAIEPFNVIEAQFEITQWLRVNSREYIQVNDEIYAKEENKNQKLENAEWFLTKWVRKIDDEKFTNLIQYLFENENENNSIIEISKNLEMKPKDINDLYLKYVATNLIYSKDTELYLNNIFFHPKLRENNNIEDIEDIEENDFIESFDEDDFEDFEEM